MAGKIAPARCRTGACTDPAMGFILDINGVDAGFEESQHPRGQPGNAGQFAKGSGNASKKAEAHAGGGRKSGALRDPASDIRRLTELKRARRQTRLEHKKAVARGDSPEKIAELKQKWEQSYKDLRAHIKGMRGEGQVIPPPPKRERKAGGEKPAQQKAEIEGEKPPEHKLEKRAPLTTEGLRKATASKTAPEQHWHERGKAWQHASARMGAIIAGTNPLRKVITNSRAMSCFYKHRELSFNDHAITMGSAKRNAEALAVVWRHEYGHAIDFNGTGNAASGRYSPELIEEGSALAKRQAALKGEQDPQALIAMVRQDIQKGKEAYPDLNPEDLKAFVPPLGLLGQLQEERMNERAAIHGPEEQKRAAAERADRRMQGYIDGVYATLGSGRLSGISHADTHSSTMFNDFCGALTMNEVGYGHANAYYRQAPFYRTTEAFANYVCLTEGQGGPIYKAILHRIAPKTCAGFEEILDARAKAASQERQAA